MFLYIGDKIEKKLFIDNEADPSWAPFTALRGMELGYRAEPNIILYNLENLIFFCFFSH